MSGKAFTKNTKKQQVVEQQPAKHEDKEEGELKFFSQLEEVKASLRAVSEQQRSLSTLVKKLETAYAHDVKKVSQRKQKRHGEYKPTGFAKESPVPNPLASFIGVQAGTLLSGPDITKKIWEQLQIRGLQHTDARVFRTNAEVTKVFGVPASVNECTKHDDPNGFNFCNLQKYIARAMGKVPKSDKKKDEQAVQEQVAAHEPAPVEKAPKKVQRNGISK